MMGGVKRAPWPGAVASAAPRGASAATCRRCPRAERRELRGTRPAGCWIAIAIHEPPAPPGTSAAAAPELVCALGGRPAGWRVRRPSALSRRWLMLLAAQPPHTFPVDGTDVGSSIDARVRKRLRVGAPLYEIE